MSQSEREDYDQLIEESNDGDSYKIKEKSSANAPEDIQQRPQRQAALKRQKILEDSESEEIEPEAEDVEEIKEEKVESSQKEEKSPQKPSIEESHEPSEARKSQRSQPKNATKYIESSESEDEPMQEDPKVEDEKSVKKETPEKSSKKPESELQESQNKDESESEDKSESEIEIQSSEEESVKKVGGRTLRERKPIEKKTKKIIKRNRTKPHVYKSKKRFDKSERKQHESRGLNFVHLKDLSEGDKYIEYGQKKEKVLKVKGADPKEEDEESDKENESGNIKVAAETKTEKPEKSSEKESQVKELNCDTNEQMNLLAKSLGSVGLVAYETLKIHSQMLNNVLKQLDSKVREGLK